MLDNDRYFPCDDDFEHVETKEMIRVYSTMERHSAMPEHVGAPGELYDLDGVTRWRG